MDSASRLRPRAALLTQLAPAEATLGHSLGSPKPGLPDGPLSAANVPTGRPLSAGAARGGFTRLF